ncbi:hypothetical protein PXJ20_09180 [Paraburkholderia sp. A1RI_3L]|uniref:hypothetical protein n=1 Tax=Paraburkholderia TaxID=1822464 RepID=UPI000344A963|nr:MULTISPECIES: hypothetical protein [Paraburkholderia]WEY38215.1 hypothetical protein P2869_14365 [Paraburkholderia sp. SUR17]
MSQPVQPSIANSAAQASSLRASHSAVAIAPQRVFASESSMRELRTVAFSLLVDRALSA